jgi:hypothetical protein
VNLVPLERAYEGVGSSEEARRPCEIATDDRLSDAGAPNRGSTSGCIGHRVHLQAVSGAPGSNVGQRPLAALTEGRFWGEDDALRRRHPNQTLKEVLPGGVARLWRKGEVAPEVNTRPCHAELKLPCVEELEGSCAPNQLVGVWRESNMHTLEPCSSSKPLSGGKQAHMPSM